MPCSDGSSSRARGGFRSRAALTQEDRRVGHRFPRSVASTSADLRDVGRLRPAADRRPDRRRSSFRPTSWRRDRTSRGDLKFLSRTLRELRYAFKVFTPYRSRRKVTVFGSARTRPDRARLRAGGGIRPGDGRRIGWLVVTGAASGIMEAGHIGAGRENSMGLNIMLPFEQYANPVIAGDSKLVHMKYFFTRKLMFVKECDAVCLLPGGFGTLDEGLEVLTLLQTGKRDMVPVVFLDAPGGDFWQAFEQFVERPAAGRTA